MPKEIYFDNSMTTRPSERAVSAMMPYLTDKWGTPLAPHRKGQELFAAITESMRSIYTLLGARDEDTFVFTSSGAEAVNHAIMAVYRDVALESGKNQFITSAIDEAPAIVAIGRLEEAECVGRMVKPNREGCVNAELIADHITPRTAMLSLSWANGLTGVIQPVNEIAALCQERGILFHLDATHVLGKLFYDLEEIQPAYLSFNGDNLHAPKGCGGLYIREGAPASPLIVGGIEQGGYRAGSYSTANLVALGEAAKEAVDARDFLCTEVARLRNTFEELVLDAYPDAIIFFREQERLPHVTVIGFPGIANEAFLYMLNQKRLYANIGGGSFQQLGLILASCGVEEPLSHSAISFSLSRETTDEEIEQAAQLIAETAKSLRKYSEKIV